MAIEKNNLALWEKVRAVPPTAQKQIGGGRLKGMTDINPMLRIKQLTEQYVVCGIGWYYDITDKQLYSGGGDEISAHIQINLFVKENGEWSKPIQGIGGSMFVSMEKNGLYTNDEALKMALTDALSVSCKALGMGADTYWSGDNTKYTKGKVELSKKDKDLVEKWGITLEKVAFFYHKGVSEVTSEDIQNAVEMQRKALIKVGKPLPEGEELSSTEAPEVETETEALSNALRGGK